MDEIADFRRDCLRLRRRAQRARGKAEAEPLSAEHLTAKKALKAAIRKSKSQKWRTTTEEVDNDPWGLGYKIMMKKLGCLPNTTMDETKMEEIVDTSTRVDRNEGPAPDDVPLFIEEELRRAAHSLRYK